MKTAIVLLLALFGVVLTARFDNIDIDKVLGNQRVLESYLKCMYDEGPCTPEGRDLREKAPEALETNCKDCTDNQKALVRKASLFLIKNRPDDWKKLSDKFDPEGKYKKAFDEFLKEKN
uniref:Chemosensory protein n=1 Tax=Helicoverpa armigera TaxID=29058 RepID=A0A0A0VDH4_HELAM|nr:chemosensory protein [Helicoverpa armigera]